MVVVPVEVFDAGAARGLLGQVVGNYRSGHEPDHATDDREHSYPEDPASGSPWRCACRAGHFRRLIRVLFHLTMIASTGRRNKKPRWVGNWCAMSVMRQRFEEQHARDNPHICQAASNICLSLPERVANFRQRFADIGAIETGVKGLLRQPAAAERFGPLLSSCSSRHAQ